MSKASVVSTDDPVISASTLSGDKVRNANGEDLGKLEELMIDIKHGRVAYAVISFGGLLGVGDKLFAIPWSALKVDTKEKCLILDVSKEQLEQAPGFPKSDWPDMADRRWGGSISKYYGQDPHWSAASSQNSTVC